MAPSATIDPRLRKRPAPAAVLPNTTTVPAIIALPVRGPAFPVTTMSPRRAPAPPPGGRATRATKRAGRRPSRGGGGAGGGGRAPPRGSPSPIFFWEKKVGRPRLPAVFPRRDPLHAGPARCADPGLHRRLD